MQTFSMLGNNTSPTITIDDTYFLEDGEGITVIKTIKGKCICGRTFIALPLGITEGEEFWIKFPTKSSEDLDYLTATDNKFHCAYCGIELSEPISLGWRLQGKNTYDLLEDLQKNGFTTGDIDKYLIEKYGQATPTILHSGDYGGIFIGGQCSCGQQYLVFHPDKRVLVEKYKKFFHLSGKEAPDFVLADGTIWQCTKCGQKLNLPTAETLTADKHPQGRELLATLVNIERDLEYSIMKKEKKLLL